MIVNLHRQSKIMRRAKQVRGVSEWEIAERSFVCLAIGGQAHQPRRTNELLEKK